MRVAIIFTSQQNIDLIFYTKGLTSMQNNIYEQDLLKQIAYRIDGYLIDNNLSQVQFAKQLGISKQIVNNMLNNYKGITTARLHQISKITQLNLNWLINGVGKQKIDNLDDDIEIIHLMNSLDSYFRSPNYSLRLLVDTLVNELVIKIRNQQNKQSENSRAYFLLIHVLNLDASDLKDSKITILNLIKNLQYTHTNAKKELYMIINNLEDVEWDFIFKYKKEFIIKLENSFGIIEKQFYKLDLKKIRKNEKNH